MTTSAPGELVVIVGPIASGKSTVAAALGVRLRSAGRTVAVLDLDDVVEDIGGFVGLTDDQFRAAQRVYGELVGSWLRRGVDVVAHGPFFEPDEQDALLSAVPTSVEPRRVLLVVSYDVALRRVTADRSRILSRHPEVLRHMYDRFESLRPDLPPSGWTFDTDAASAETIAEELAWSLIERRSQETR